VFGPESVASEKAIPTRPPGSAVMRRRTLRAALVSLVVLGVAVAFLVSTRTAERSDFASTHDVLPGAEGRGAGQAISAPDFGGRPAVAVLPFDNLSPDPDQAFFADGLAEDLITRLATWRAFPVIAPSSTAAAVWTYDV